MSTEAVLSIVAIIVSVAVFLLGCVFGIIGWFASRHVTSIDKKLDGLSTIDIKLSGLEIKVDNHTEQLNETCDRLRKVEEHVSNTERVAVMERQLKTADEEIRNLRNFSHWAANALIKIAEAAKCEVPTRPVTAI